MELVGGGNKTKCLRWNQSCGESWRYKEQTKVKDQREVPEERNFVVSLATVAEAAREGGGKMAPGGFVEERRDFGKPKYNRVVISGRR